MLATLLGLALIAAGLAVWQRHGAITAQRLAIARGLWTIFFRPMARPSA